MRNYCDVNPVHSWNGVPFRGKLVFFYNVPSKPTEKSVYAEDGTDLGNVVYTDIDGRMSTQIFLEGDYLVEWWLYTGDESVIESDDDEEHWEHVFTETYVDESGSSEASAFVSTVSELLDISGMEDGDVAVLTGYYKDGDSPIRSYVWNANSTAAIDGGAVIGNYGQTGRWILVSPTRFLDVRIFGAMPFSLLSSAEYYDSQLANAFSYCASRGLVLVFPKGTNGEYIYGFTSPLSADIDAIANDGVRFYPKVSSTPSLTFRTLSAKRGGQLALYDADSGTITINAERLETNWVQKTATAPNGTAKEWVVTEAIDLSGVDIILDKDLIDSPFRLRLKNCNLSGDAVGVIAKASSVISGCIGVKASFIEDADIAGLLRNGENDDSLGNSYEADVVLTNSTLVTSILELLFSKIVPNTLVYGYAPAYIKRIKRHMYASDADFLKTGSWFMDGEGMDTALSSAISVLPRTGCTSTRLENIKVGKDYSITFPSSVVSFDIENCDIWFSNWSNNANFPTKKFTVRDSSVKIESRLFTALDIVDSSVDFVKDVIGSAGSLVSPEFMAVGSTLSGQSVSFAHMTVESCDVSCVLVLDATYCNKEYVEFYASGTRYRNNLRVVKGRICGNRISANVQLKAHFDNNGGPFSCDSVIRGLVISGNRFTDGAYVEDATVLSGNHATQGEGWRLFWLPDEQYDEGTSSWVAESTHNGYSIKWGVLYVKSDPDVIGYNKGFCLESPNQFRIADNSFIGTSTFGLVAGITTTNPYGQETVYRQTEWTGTLKELSSMDIAPKDKDQYALLADESMLAKLEKIVFKLKNDTFLPWSYNFERVDGAIQKNTDVSGTPTNNVSFSVSGYQLVPSEGVRDENVYPPNPKTVIEGVKICIRSYEMNTNFFKDV